MTRYDEAEADWLAAIRILNSVGFHDGEIAVSLLMLAHLAFDRDVAREIYSGSGEQ